MALGETRPESKPVARTPRPSSRRNRRAAREPSAAGTLARYLQHDRRSDRVNRLVAMQRTASLVALFAVAIALGMAQASFAAIGSSDVVSATEAPWSVHIEMTRPGSEVGGACSGSILDANRVLTAGHCITNDDEALWPDFEVRAGTTKLDGTTEGQEQVRDAVRVTPHPFYVSDSYVQDVAVLEVEPPFDLSTPYVQPISIANSEARPHHNVRFFGWGDIAPETFSSDEHQLELTPLRQWQCPAELQGDPSFSCLRSATGSSCPGDSGSGVVGGNPPHLFVSMSLGSCTPGGIIGGTDLTSPEIRAWLAGNPEPPRAPEGRTYPLVRRRARVGTYVRCESGSWTGHPSLSTAFVDPSRGRVLQEGRSLEFKVPRTMLHHRIACISIASSAGGRTEMRSSNAPLIGAHR